MRNIDRNSFTLIKKLRFSLSLFLRNSRLNDKFFKATPIENIIKTRQTF
jgi:hypothetical protein